MSVEVQATIPDAAVRQKALEVGHSFLVQAPAGSGKTELLIQRLLALLACAKQAPEEVLAITFTRKAAFEMRSRVLQALQAGAGPKPATAHGQKTWQLARRVLDRDQQLNWQLECNPERLRITTIDAFCAGLVKQMPMLSGLFAQPEITDMAHRLYQLAADELLADFADDSLSWHQSLQALLVHSDNRAERLRDLLCSMLSRREQWLEIVLAASKKHDLKDHLEQSIQLLACQLQEQIKEVFPSDQLSLLQQLLAFGASNLQRDAPESGTQGFWHQAADLLLTKDGAWRKKIDKSVGFPAPSSTKDPVLKQQRQQAKAQAAALIDELNDLPQLALLLDQLRQVLKAELNERQWSIIEALLDILPKLVGRLQLVFAREGQVDFNEIGLAAARSLGEEDNPTDLALVLDNSINHILLDEFQDTSKLQFNLLEKLVAGWQPGDGRTLFLVGDPMQSIYRFRQADVSLFMQTKDMGIGSVQFEFLCLSANFRSSGYLINWFNQAFSQVFNSSEDKLTQAVAYSKAEVPTNEQMQQQSSVHWHLYDDQQAVPWDDLILQICQDRQAGESVAILVRARSHLKHILPALQRSGLAYQSVDIENLSDRVVVQDLFTLSLALSNISDHLSWLAALRAPWCGLALSDLTIIARWQGEQTIWQCLQCPKLQASLSAAGQAQSRRFVQALQPVMAGYLRQRLTDQVEAAWLALAGPACVHFEQDLANAQHFLKLLSECLQLSGCGVCSLQVTSQELLEKRLQSAKAISMPCQDAIEVMTIHKSKGLEFDRVIMPELGRGNANSDQPILLWEIQRLFDRGWHLLMAPIKGQDQTKDDLYAFLSARERRREREEDKRLLYVAATRARRQLHLVGQLAWDDAGQIKKPTSSSFLSLLWPVVPEASCLVADTRANASATQDQAQQVLSWPRLPVDYHSSWQPQAKPEPADDDDLNQPAIWQWPAQVGGYIGTVVHRYLAHWIGMARDAICAHWQLAQQSIAVQLQEMGVPAELLDQACAQVKYCLDNIIADPTGQWLLQQHDSDVVELPLSVYQNHSWHNYVIDRSFIDANGQRWLIDYKSASVQGDIETFIAQQKAFYHHQLTTYSQAWMQTSGEVKPPRLALYLLSVPRLEIIAS